MKEPTPAKAREEALAVQCEAVRAGERRAVAKAITLLESTRPDLAAEGQAILERLVAMTGRGRRVGITGAPGVGKSTFIEALGLELLSAGHRVAVLAVDPTSPVTRGSILGDKTRMERLAQDERAFIRPSPSALFTTSRSASSMTPFFRPWSSSPAPGWSSTTKVSTMEATATSD